LDAVTVILFALAVNMDSFAAGTAYGMRSIKIPVISVIIICITSMLAVTASMLAGNTAASLITSFIPAHKIGGILLLCIGLWVLYQSLRQTAGLPKTSSNKNKEKNERDSFQTQKPIFQLQKPIFQLRIPLLGLVIQVLKEPPTADLDQSGYISPAEALLLGTALAMDALTAGFAVSMLGFSIPFVAVTVGLGHFLLITAGIFWGRQINNSNWGQKLSVLPGCILIILGLSKII